MLNTQEVPPLSPRGHFFPSFFPPHRLCRRFIPQVLTISQHLPAD